MSVRLCELSMDRIVEHGALGTTKFVVQIEMGLQERLQEHFYSQW